MPNVFDAILEGARGPQGQVLWRRLIPKDSLLHYWMNYVALTEAPQSYAMATGLAMFGALLRRNLRIQQGKDVQTFPNVSTILVGPSGIGKDTIINSMMKVVNSVDSTLEIGGVTIETIYEQLLKRGDPACAIFPAKELSDLFGKKDYQAGMIQNITDLLSTGNAKDVSTRSRPNAIIRRPTLTMVGGSTAEWLQSEMPNGTLDGGFIPRFAVFVEYKPYQSVPIVGVSNLPEDRRLAEESYDTFIDGLGWLLKKFNRPRVAIIDEEALDYYTNFYNQRLKLFPETVKSYANRSRDLVLKYAMLSAAFRGTVVIETQDVKFGVALISIISERLEPLVIPPTLEGRCVQYILGRLPINRRQLVWDLNSNKFTRQIQTAAISTLVDSGRMKGLGELWVPGP